MTYNDAIDKIARAVHISAVEAEQLLSEYYHPLTLSIHRDDVADIIADRRRIDALPPAERAERETRKKGNSAIIAATERARQSGVWGREIVDAWGAGSEIQGGHFSMGLVTGTIELVDDRACLVMADGTAIRVESLSAISRPGQW